MSQKETKLDLSAEAEQEPLDVESAVDLLVEAVSASIGGSENIGTEDEPLNQVSVDPNGRTVMVSYIDRKTNQISVLNARY
jgi:hypothetical protein